MIPYNQRDAKITNTESFKLKSCMRKAADAIDKRFCFDIIPEDRWIVCSISSIAHCACPGLTLCTLCKHSQRRTGSCGWRLWMGQSPCKLRANVWKSCSLDSSLFFRYAHTPGGKPSNANQTFLDESGFSFVQDCLAGLENRGLEDQGMYRVVGVGSKVTKLRS